MERTVKSMSTLKAIVSGGRAIIEDVGDYPDGTELELEIVENDEMSEEERARLRDEISLSLREGHAGELFDAKDVIADLRSRA